MKMGQGLAGDFASGQHGPGPQQGIAGSAHEDLRGRHALQAAANPGQRCCLLQTAQYGADRPAA